MVRVAAELALTVFVLGDTCTVRFGVCEMKKEMGVVLVVDSVTNCWAVPPEGALIVTLFVLGLIAPPPPDVAAVIVTLTVAVVPGPVKVMVPVQLFGLVLLESRQLSLAIENCSWEGVVSPVLVMLRNDGPDTVKVIGSPVLVTLTLPTELLAN
jgi:hypothetical protein